MQIIEIAALPNGAHKNQTWYEEAIPEGWALIPDDMAIPASFPFVDIVVEEKTYYRAVEQPQEVPKTREIPSCDDEGNPITDTEEYTEIEMVTVHEPYTRMEVTEMTEKEKPEPKPGILDNPSTGDNADMTEAMAAAILEGVESI